MFFRKLKALGYELANEFDINDMIKFRQLIAWIEDQKIRQYRIEDRSGLREVDSDNWSQAFHQYLSDIECPFNEDQLEPALDWVLILALRLDYEDNLQKYQELDIHAIRNEPQMVSSNPIDNLDFESDQFKEGVRQLAQMLKIPIHPTNHLITLRAISILIRKYFSMESEHRLEPKNGQTTSNKIEDTSMPIKTNIKDPVLNKSAKLIRLLYINDLRELQTDVNKIIADVQSITANPKTDTTLGKVGV